MRNKQKVAVAMSGGVDSGVAAALLVEQGYEVIGLHLRFWSEDIEASGLSRSLREPLPFINKLRSNPNVRLDKPSPSLTDPNAGFLKKVENRCCDIEGLEAARKTAAKLGIPFYVKDYAEDFKKIVVDYFLAEYAAGRTPNPCVVCNQFIKFGKLLEYARALGCQFLATGHYARIEAGNWRLEAGKEARSSKLEKSSQHASLGFDLRQKQHPASSQASSFKHQASVYRLLKGVDDSKDQSYFLWTLTQDKLAHILFPVGDRRKSEVKNLARVKNLPVSERPESFEVCFIQDRDYREFLKRHIPGAIKPGEVVNTKSEVIGKHFGLPLYTIGQRKGFEINLKSQISNLKYGVPLYVVDIDTKRNRLIVGRGKESERQKFAVGNMNWIGGLGSLGDLGILKCEMRIRYQGTLLKAELRIENCKLKIALKEPVRGVTPGQSAVFYAGEELLGGGVIE